MRETVLEVRRVTKRFALRAGVFQRAAGEVHAVDGVDLSIPAGGSIGLVGESGCGKSTLGRMLIGLLEPTSGEVRYRGVPLSALPSPERQRFRRDVQMIFQDPTNSLNPKMTVEEIVAEPLVIHRLASGGARSRRIDELLAAVGLAPRFRRRRPRALSGGERQRVGIARALVTEPSVLICDEPIASLDVSVGAQILDLLKTLQAQRGLSLLLISHDLRAVAFLCETIAVMYLGRIVESAPTIELLERPRHPYTELLLRAASLDLDAPAAGERPSNVHPPSGCRFRTRCPIAEDMCERREPPLEAKESGRMVACHKRP